MKKDDNRMLLDYTDVKFVHDNTGATQEVIIDYTIFQKIEAFLARHAYFYDEAVQKQLQSSENDLTNGQYIEVKPNNIENAMAWLHERYTPYSDGYIADRVSQTAPTHSEKVR